MATDSWYSKAQKYWDGIPATVEGVLGGFEVISPLDCSTSITFMKDHVVDESISNIPMGENKIQKFRACDCGAGIGRVSAGFLLHLFDQVDLVEPNQAFLNAAKKHITESEKRVGKCIAKGLQEFYPEEGRYDLIWCQWVLGHLKDGEKIVIKRSAVMKPKRTIDDLVEFFKRCKKALEPRRGLIGIKENVTKTGVDVDEVDSSVTRSDSILRGLFERAGLTLIKHQKQEGFPRELYGVHLYLLK